MKRSALLLILLLLPLYQVLASEPNFELVNAWWGTPERASTAVSGQGITPLTVFLKAKASVRVNYLELEIPPPLTDAQGRRVAKVIPSLQLGRNVFSKGEAFYSTFYVDVPAVGSSSYKFKLRVNYDLMGASPSLNNTDELEFGLKVEGASTITFTLSGNLLEGASTVLKLNIHNSGRGTATITSIQVSASYAKVLNPMIQQMYQLPPGKTITYDIGALVPKGVDKDEDVVMVSISYQSAGKSITLSKAFKIPIESSDQGSGEESPYLAVETDQDMLEAGALSKVNLVVKNLGGEEARDVRLQLNSKTVTIVGPSLHYLGDLAPGDSESVEIELIPSEQAKSYELMLTFTYKEYVEGEDVEKQTTLTLGFGRREQAKIVISSLEGSYLNGRVRVRGLLANIGNREADHINVSMEGSNCFSSSYVGSLGDGESTGFSLTCSVNELSSPIKLKVKVRYLASPEKWEETYREITVEPPQAKTNQAQQAGGYNVYALAIAALAGILVGLVLGRLIFKRGEEIEV